MECSALQWNKMGEIARNGMVWVGMGGIKKFERKSRDVMT
jgi:hypothetical protein